MQLLSPLSSSRGVSGRAEGSTRGSGTGPSRGSSGEREPSRTPVWLSAVAVTVGSGSEPACAASGFARTLVTSSISHPPGPVEIVLAI